MQKSGTVPHTALIYTDNENRNSLISSCIRGSNASWNSMTVLSVRPDADARAFRSILQGKRPGRGRAILSVIDVRESLAKGTDAGENIRSLLTRARQSGSKTSPPLIIGDWTYQVYDDFQTALGVEEALERKSNLVCCYRGEGFCSLNTRQIARIFELHDHVLFGSTLFRTEPK